MREGAWSMRSIRSKKSSGGTRSKLADERGQTILEYLLVLAIVVSMFLLVAKPFLGDIAKKFQDMSKKGFFSEDPTGANFYYYPLPRSK